MQPPSLRENPMGSRKILPLLLSMSVPPMISMMIQGLYNIVDSIFVAHLSQEALTAVSLVYPLQNLTLSVAVGLGVGLNACIARSLGAGRPEEAGRAAVHGLLCTGYIPFCLCWWGCSSRSPSCGSSPRTKPYWPWGWSMPSL